MVADVESYPEFVPFCTGYRLVPEDMNIKDLAWVANNLEGYMQFAATSVGLNAVTDSYLSRIRFIPLRSIQVRPLQAIASKFLNSKSCL